MVKLKVFSSRYDHAISLFIVWWRFYLGFIINGYSLLVQVGFKIQTTLTIFIFNIEFNFEKKAFIILFLHPRDLLGEFKSAFKFMFFFYLFLPFKSWKNVLKWRVKSWHHWSVRTTAPKRESPNDSSWMHPSVSLIKNL